MRRTLDRIACMLAVAATVACGKPGEHGDEERPRAKASSSIDAGTGAASPSASIAVPRFGTNDGGAQVDVRVEAPFEIELTSPRNQGYKYAWLPAVIAPPGIDALGKEILEPGKDIDGGSYRHLYRFRATTTGTFLITIANTSAQSKDEVPTYTLTVRVAP